jgi:transcriptional regulator of heat shock response
MAEKQRINTLKARSKNKKIREYDSRTKRDVEYQISRRPLPFVELTKDRDLAVLETVSNLLLKGATFSEIRETVLKEHDKDFSIDQIKKYRDTCHQIWVNELTANFDEVLSKDLARIDYQERVLWEALEESKKGKRRIHTERTNSSGEAKSVTFSSENESEDVELSGIDMKIFEKIMELNKERRKLLGIYAPERKDAPASNNIPEQITINLVGGVNNKKIEVQDAEIVK